VDNYIRSHRHLEEKFVVLQYPNSQVHIRVKNTQFNILLLDSIEVKHTPNGILHDVNIPDVVLEFLSSILNATRAHVTPLTVPPVT
jgi:hypothetical protein